MLLFFSASAAFAARNHAAELDTAQRLLARGDYARAYQAYLKHARTNPLAQFSLGSFYKFGWGRPQDAAAACRWFGKAAPGNIPAAQNFYADCLRQGIHAPADAAAAARWYREAAKGGYLSALCSLAEMAMTGNGVPKDPAEGLALCRQAAEKGLPPSQVRLGRFYLEEDGVRDYQAALQWFEFAARGNYSEGQFYLARMLESGLGTKPDSMAARNWYEAAAGQGYLPAYLPLAKIYASLPADSIDERLGEVELAKAYLWSAAAERRLQGDSKAEAQLLVKKLLEQVPSSWLSDLDRKVEAHLARFAQ